MDCHNYITVAPERKRGQHLGREDRGAIQQLNKQGYSLRAIAREINCSPSTILYELRRGTPRRKSYRGRAPEYSAKRGLAVFHYIFSKYGICIDKIFLLSCPVFCSILHPPA
uniref:helix-turn-helix domain-containing protein n=1 Tax=Pectinatus haikarae TaxID=349096 RepID=UPI0038B2EA42